MGICSWPAAGTDGTKPTEFDVPMTASTSAWEAAWRSRVIACWGSFAWSCTVTCRR